MSVLDFPLVGKIAVVTGAGSGINFCFVRLAVQAGARGVIVADLKLRDEAEEWLRTADHKVVVFTPCDVSKRADLENLVKVSQEKFGDTPDIYVAGAGVFEPKWSNFWDDTEEDGYAQIDINIIHPMKLSRIAIRELLKRDKRGVILIVSSLAGFQGTFSAPSYCATKHATVGFVRSLAELDRLEGIKVVAVNPGLVRTPLWTDHPKKMAQFGYEEGNTITPNDVAAAMVEVVTKFRYPGGTCLETAVSGWRTLGTWNVEPPAEVGTKVPQEAIDRNYAPILALLKKERQSHL